MEATRRRLRRKRAIDLNESKVEKVDFKMVTFTLAGKDYGIDIMKVKEIAKFLNFTYVPNTPPFVRGVYNLRGEIISIIDMREMFNLPYTPREKTVEENGLILRLESNLIGVIVDEIDKVVGISSDTIQPPHPIFGDINIKYISGVVENDDRLYIILDVERILGKNEDASDQEARTAETVNQMAAANLKPASVSEQAAVSPPETENAAVGAAPAQVSAQQKSLEPNDDQINKQFVSETLEAFEKFYVSDVNRSWFEQRYSSWKTERGADHLQFESQSDAGMFIQGFGSQYTGRLWEADLMEELSAVLPDQVDNQLHIWNPGCGKGYETYSLAVLLKKKYPNVQLKIWASDKDLLSVSGAPNLLFSSADIPDGYAEYMVEGPNGLSFNQEIKDAILFEYHDIVNAHTMPPIQLMVARDLFSYLHPEDSSRILGQLDERMRAGGIVILGRYEEIPMEYGWSPVQSGKLRYFRK